MLVRRLRAHAGLEQQGADRKRLHPFRRSAEGGECSQSCGGLQDLSSICHEQTSRRNLCPATTRMVALIPARPMKASSSLLNSCVFCLGLPKNGDVWVRILPQSEKILIGEAALWPVSRHGHRAPYTQVREPKHGRDRIDPAVVQNLLKFRSRLRTFLKTQE